MTSFKRAACSDLEELDATVLMKLRMQGTAVFLSRFILMHRFINLIGENTDAIAPKRSRWLSNLSSQAAVSQKSKELLGIFERNFVFGSFNPGNAFSGKDAAAIGITLAGPC